MKRRLIPRAIVFLLGGAIVNIAVAWACAYWCGSSSRAQTIRAHFWDKGTVLTEHQLAPIIPQMTSSGWRREMTLAANHDGKNVLVPFLSLSGTRYSLTG